MDGRNRFLLQCPATVNVKMLFISPFSLSLSTPNLMKRTALVRDQLDLWCNKHTHNTRVVSALPNENTHTHTQKGAADTCVLLLSVGRREILPFLFFTISRKKMQRKQLETTWLERFSFEQVSPPVGFFVCYHFDTVSYTAACNTENKSSSS